MIANRPLYMSGGEVRIGDRVRYKGMAANVVVISDGEGGDFASGYGDYDGCDAGILVCDDDGTLTFIAEPTEDLEFVHR